VGLLALTNGVGYSNQVLTAGSGYYFFTVSSNAVQANFEVLLPSGNVDLLIGQGNRGYGLTNVSAPHHSGSTNEFIRAARNGTACSLTPGIGT